VPGSLSAGNVTALGGAGGAGNTGGLGGSGGIIQLLSTAGSISLSGGASASGGGSASGYGQGGSVQLQTTTGNISVNGSINASGASGGQININSGGNFSLTSGNITADGANGGNGGSISITTNITGPGTGSIILPSGAVLSAAGNGTANGGNISIMAVQTGPTPVAIPLTLSGGSINISGASGGGTGHGGSVSITTTGSIITSANTIIAGNSLQFGSYGGDLILNAANNINIGGPAALGAGAVFSLTAPQLNIGGNIQLYPSSQLNNSSPLLLGSTGTISGSGSISGDLDNSGTVSPGGALNIGGNYTEESTGLLNVTISGPVAGSGYGELAVVSKASLGGTLDLTLLPGASFAAGTKFDILNASSVSGIFSTINIPLDSLGQPIFSVQYDSGDLMVTALTTVPEPTTIALAASSLALLARRRPRKNIQTSRRRD